LLPYIAISYYERYAFPLLGVKALACHLGGRSRVGWRRPRATVTAAEDDANVKMAQFPADKQSSQRHGSRPEKSAAWKFAYQILMNPKSTYRGRQNPHRTTTERSARNDGNGANDPCHSAPPQTRTRAGRICTGGRATS